MAAAEGELWAWDLSARTTEPRSIGDGTDTLALTLGTLNGVDVAVAGGGDGAIRTWDIASATLIEPVLQGHEGAVRHVGIVGGGAHGSIVSAGEDQTLRFWSPRVVVPIASMINAITVATDDLVVVGAHAGLLAVAIRHAR